jgi:molybdopterin synthase catalytic subunit
MVYCEITREPLDVAALLARVRSDSDGALILFVGVVRDHDTGRAVQGLRYEAYEEMARGKIETICSEVQARYEIGDVAVVHRTGELVVGEASVVISVAAPHRDAAYRASREIIERLKREVPIWKQERYADGGVAWLEGSTPPLPRSG